jgi:hypothetical protein
VRARANFEAADLPHEVDVGFAARGDT